MSFATGLDLVIASSACATHILKVCGSVPSLPR